MKLQHEIRHAAAGLKKTPMFVFTLVFTLALTLGALIAAFNLNQLIVFKSLPYPNAESLYILGQTEIRDGEIRKGRQQLDAQVQMYKKSQSFVSSALVLRSRGILASVASEPIVLTIYTTDEFFDLLTVPFELGGGFSKSAEIIDARAETVISYDTWQGYFSGRKDIIGQSIKFDHDQFKIVGVIKKGFKEPHPFSDSPSQIYLPAAYSALSKTNGTSATTALLSLVKLTADQNKREVGDQLSSIFSDFIRSGANAHLYSDAELKAELTQLSVAVKGDSGTITLMILVGALVLLLIAFVNVINLYLSHINKKQQTLAICACLGAKPKALFKRLFVESLLLTILSTVFALVIAAWLLVLTRELGHETLPRLQELGLDLATVAFSMVIAVILAALLAYFGRFAVNYDALKEHLNASGKGTSAQVSPKVRHTLIASQVSLTGVLIVVTSMVLQMSLATANHPLGIDIENVVSVEVDPGKNYTTKSQKWALAMQIKQHFSQLPQVDVVANTALSPITEGHAGTILYDINKQRLGGFLYNRIDQDFLEQVKLPLLHGRNFNREEVMDHSSVALLSKAMALAIFNKTNVVGERVYRSNGKAITVVGVVDDYFSVSNNGEPYFYLTTNGGLINILLKIKPSMNMSKLEILQQLRTLDSTLRIQELLKLEQTASELVYQYRLVAWLAGGLSLFALILACTGIYGVISYSTQMRRYEMGVRMALGAKRKRIINMVLKDAFNPILIGLGISLMLSVLLYGIASNQFAQLGQPDIIQVSASLILLMIFSLLACYLPVNSIVKQDPVKALRNE